MTNGICWQFYTDTKNINIMDDEPFLILNFDEIGNNKKITDDDLKILKNLSKQSYNFNNIKDLIINKLLLNSLIKEIKECSEGSNDFVKFLFKKINPNSSIVQKKIDEYKNKVILAFKQFIDSKININVNTIIDDTNDIDTDNEINNNTSKSCKLFSFYRKGIKMVIK